MTLLIAGCAWFPEPVKVVLGTSTRALEEARTDSLSKVYRCSFDECFDGVLSLERHGKKITTEEYKKEEDEKENPSKESLALTPKVEDDELYEVYSKDPIRGIIVVMGVRGHIETTEVGIFLSRYSPSSIKVEVTSLSTPTKEQVANFLFKKLDKTFSEGN